MNRARSTAVVCVRGLAASFAVFAFAASAAMGAETSERTTADERNIFRTVIYYSYPTATTDVPIVVVGGPGGPEFVPNANFEAQEAPGCTISYERKIVDFLGVSIGASWVRYEYEATLDETATQTTFVRLGDQTVNPFMATVLWHPLKRSIVDWYVGAGYAYVRYGDLRNDFTGEKFESDSDSGFVAQTGFDFVLRGKHPKESGLRWAVNFDVRYIDTQSTGVLANSQGIEINPLDFSLGVAARF